MNQSKFAQSYWFGTFLLVHTVIRKISELENLVYNGFELRAGLAWNAPGPRYTDPDSRRMWTIIQPSDRRLHGSVCTADTLER